MDEDDDDDEAVKHQSVTLTAAGGKNRHDFSLRPHFIHLLVSVRHLNIPTLYSSTAHAHAHTHNHTTPVARRPLQHHEAPLVLSLSRPSQEREASLRSAGGNEVNR